MASIDSNLATQTKPEKPRKAPLVSIAAKEGFVVLEIGPQKQHYHVHKALLTHHSEYFRNAFNGSWKESDDKLVTLSDVDTVAVDIFVHWLYNQQMPNEHQCDSLHEQNMTSDEYVDDDTLITGFTKALVFGDRFLAPIFRQAAHDCIVDTLINVEDPPASRPPPFFTATQYAMDNLPSNHSILDLFINVHCRHWDVSDYGRVDEKSGIADLLKQNLSPVMLIRIVARYSSMAINLECGWWNEELERCDYHDHVDDKEREGCERK
ncbi:uncharacterized protein J4E88_004136 [Alternaria novae-zelandiae]|uniref:uncharacterized protein n=1 Tax=Alternaria novae-zelandiae TaxID=430562 RepID=UPI0020C2A4B6|nr:uncharacterized protein J4E88_004136 [Alternaria novae-zelandiae]KAI4684695.1 hypothetical protein J4E88_004136 [Alternaria novae-zelandiae]